MNKVEYLFKAFRNKAYTKKHFLLSISSILADTNANNGILSKIPFAMYRDSKNEQYFFHDENGEKVILDEPYSPTKPLFNKNEKFTVDPSSHPCIKDEMITTYGIFLVNIICLYHAIGDDFDYINSYMDAGTIKKIIANRMVDNLKEGEELPPGKSTVDQCLRITEQFDYLSGLNMVFVKASSVDMLTVHPDVIALRDKLLDELEEQGLLGDPTAVESAIKKVTELDTHIQLTGPSKDFYTDIEKFINNSRKKMFVIFEMIPDWNTGKYTLLRNSLNEGWEGDKFPQYINTAISASYDRGTGTGEGGAEVKAAIKLTNRIIRDMMDCGTTRTESVILNKYNIKGWEGSYRVTPNGELAVVTSEDKDLFGTTVQMRVPYCCKNPDGNLCLTCVGHALGDNPKMVSPETVYIFTGLMIGRMKSMHVSKLKTVKISLFGSVR